MVTRTRLNITLILTFLVLCFLTILCQLHIVWHGPHYLMGHCKVLERPAMMSIFGLRNETEASQYELLKCDYV